LSKDEQVDKVQFWTYILRCADGSYYVGHTDDLERRVAMHQDGSLGGYTASRRPLTLIHAEPFDSRDEAFQRERQIKGWSRAKKDALARCDWDTLQQLSKSAHPSTGSG
jgi:predicted GIY-YIG superfamily endonuclease